MSNDQNKIHLPVATDNRDMTTTVVTLDNGYQVEIDPIELFKNMLENVGPLGEDLLERVTDWSSTD